MGAVNGHGHDRDGEVRQQYADAGHELLYIVRPRSLAFRKTISGCGRA